MLASVPLMPITSDVQDHIGVVTLDEPPHNFLNVAQVRAIADALDEFDEDTSVRAAVIVAEGRSFCAGANFGGGAGQMSEGTGGSPADLYVQAARLCGAATPFIAAVHGPAIGGGLGLAMAANMRVTCPEARFSANFVRLGIHQGFGLSVTLPELIGPSRAAYVLLGGRRFNGEEATALGMADFCVPADQVRDKAFEIAGEIAEGAPLAIAAINRTLRDGLADRVRKATEHEAAEQNRLFQTSDAREGMKAVNERRRGEFTGS